MATRMNAQEERLATLRSVMNVIALLDQSSPQRARPHQGFDLRPLAPLRETGEHDDSWDAFLCPPSRIAERSRDRERQGRGA